MRKNKTKKIPKFKTEEEAARFWDTHSPLDFEDELEEIKGPVEGAPELMRKIRQRQNLRKRLLTLRMTQEQIELARKIAEKKGCGYQTQMRMWVVEGIQRELKVHPEIAQEKS